MSKSGRAGEGVLGLEQEPAVKATGASVLALNGGSSSIKFALYRHAGETLERGLHGMIDRIGSPGTQLTGQDARGQPLESRSIAASDHRSAANVLIDWLAEQDGFVSIAAVGHRVVHGMKHLQPELVTPDLLAELHRLRPYDPDHLPREIELIEAFRQRQPQLPQVACFDTAFHQAMPPGTLVRGQRQLCDYPLEGFHLQYAGQFQPEFRSKALSQRNH